jgi:hypothetical protein
LGYIGKLLKEIKPKLKKAARMAECFSDIVWRQKCMIKETKSKLYKAIVRPIMIYALEPRAET